MATLVKTRFGHCGANDYGVFKDGALVGYLYRWYAGRTRQFPNRVYLWSFASMDAEKYGSKSWKTFKDARSEIERW